MGNRCYYLLHICEIIGRIQLRKIPETRTKNLDNTSVLFSGHSSVLVEYPESEDFSSAGIPLFDACGPRLPGRRWVDFNAEAETAADQDGHATWSVYMQKDWVTLTRQI